MLRARGAAAILGVYMASSLILHPSSFAWAAHPFVTDDTGTQGQGNWQLELQGDLLRSDRTADTGSGPVEQKRKVNLFVPVLSYGILENLDIQLGLSYTRQRTTENGVETEDESGMSDSTLEVKWRFFESGAFSLALKPGLVLPTGNEEKGLGTGKTSWGIALLATVEADPWTFLANVAYSDVRFKRPQDEAESRSDLWRVSGGLSYAVAKDVRLVGEAGLRVGESRNDPYLPDRTSQFGMIGIIYSPSKNVDFDAGFRKNFNDAEFEKAYLVGATFRW
jgi:hypothetical protein